CDAEAADHLHRDRLADPFEDGASHLTEIVVLDEFRVGAPRVGLQVDTDRVDAGLDHPKRDVACLRGGALVRHQDVGKDVTVPPNAGALAPPCPPPSTVPMAPAGPDPVATEPLQALLGPQLPAGQARMIYDQGPEAVVFPLLTRAKRAAERPANPAAPVPS